MQYALGLSGAAGFVFILILLPETSHPGTRGVDKLMRETNGAQKYVFVNPLKSLWLLRSPNLLAVVSIKFNAYNAVLTMLLDSCRLDESPC
jgi:hypothetical protein